MLTISPLRSSNEDAKDGGEFVLEDIDFDDLFVGFDELPDLEIDPCDIFADFSFNSSEDGDGNNKVSTSEENDIQHKREGYCKENSSKEEMEVVSARTNEVEKKPPSSKTENNVKSQKSSSKKSSQSKKKAKVDWTPELHRRFVQAVEQLGVDKAVPSRILELMGIDCLTRHNIASHLQKYRSHRKHLLAREAEAASWSHRRQLYTNGTNHGGGKAMGMKPSWAPQPQPMVGFPPTMHHQNFRPLHVWGHPQSVEHPQLVPVWPRPQWAPPRPAHGPIVPADPTYWHPHPHYNLRTLTQGTPCYPPPPLIPQARYSTPPVAGIPPAHPIFRPPPQTVPPPKIHSSPHAEPSNKSIDTAIEDVLSKPWLPLPLGLKPPSLDSVMVELQKQGVAKVPPASTL